MLRAITSKKTPVVVLGTSAIAGFTFWHQDKIPPELRANVADKYFTGAALSASTVESSKSLTK